MNEPSISYNFGSFKAMMGTGPYYLDYFDTDPDAGSWRLEKFANYWGGWAGKHAKEIIEKGVVDWSTRKAMFITEDPSQQVDLCYVPRQSTGELEGETGIRYMYDLPTLTGNGLFFNYDPDPLSLYLPQINGVDQPDFFSDRHARLAFEYTYNDTAYIQTVFLGEAFSCGNPIIQGIAYYNASKPHRTIDVAKVTSHLQAMWGGVPWAGTFSVTLLYNTGSLARQTLAQMIANVINGIKPGSVTVTGIPWATYLTYLYSNQLTSFVLGWQADFPDPHNWMMPFMHSEGDFSGFQNIDYGDDPTTMDWVSNTYGGSSPYNNYKGDSVTLSTPYVDALIEKAIQLPDTAGPYHKGDGSRNEAYEELMDIFFGEAATVMTAQTKGRHYERDWVQGWYYNIIWPGNWYYTMYKEDEAAVVHDVAALGWESHSSPWTRNVIVENLGDTWIYFELYERNYNYNADSYTETKNATGWLAPGASWEWVTTTPGPNAMRAGKSVRVKMGTWKLTTTGFPELTDENSSNNIYQPLSTKGSEDLGGGDAVNATLNYFNYDGFVNGKDLQLYLQVHTNKKHP
jgi:peptide/nickel transport system substrate-binding protein